MTARAANLAAPFVSAPTRWQVEHTAVPYGRVHITKVRVHITKVTKK
jgi:hypothetical protein